MSNFREKKLAADILETLIEDCGDGYCRYTDPNMTDNKAAEYINAKLGDKLREPFEGVNIGYIRVELFGKLYDKAGGRARPSTGDFDAQEAIRRTRDELFSEVGTVRTMVIMLARTHRDLLLKFGEGVPEHVSAIADTPTWTERDRG